MHQPSFTRYISHLSFYISVIFPSSVYIRHLSFYAWAIFHSVHQPSFMYISATVHTINLPSSSLYVTHLFFYISQPSFIVYISRLSLYMYICPLLSTSAIFHSLYQLFLVLFASRLPFYISQLWFCIASSPLLPFLHPQYLTKNISLPPLTASLICVCLHQPSIILFIRHLLLPTSAFLLVIHQSFSSLFISQP